MENWKTPALIKKAKSEIGEDRIILAPSCSLLHVPYNIENEHDEKGLPKAVKKRMAFAVQKTEELILLKELAGKSPSESALKKLQQEKTEAPCFSHNPDWITASNTRSQENAPTI